MFDIVEFVKQQERFFCEALTEPTLTWAKESQFAIQQFQKNSFLADTARGNLSSAQNAIINVAAIGITLNPASKLAYLVPRKRLYAWISVIWGFCIWHRSQEPFSGGNANLFTRRTFTSPTVLTAPPRTNTTHSSTGAHALAVIVS